MTADPDPHVADLPSDEEPSPRVSEDWLAVLLGGLVLLATLAVVYASRPGDLDQRVAEHTQAKAALKDLQKSGTATKEDLKAASDEADKRKKAIAPNPAAAYLATPGVWDADPADSLTKKGESVLPGIAGAFVLSLVVFSIGVWLMGHSVGRFLPAFVVLFLLAWFAYVLAGQKVIEHYGLEYVLWALVVGLLISNTVGTPAWLRPAVRTEFYIKTGLVLLGAEILFSRLLSLGLPGIFLSWVTTPVVLITTYLFGQYVLKLPSRSLNLVISADMSVCGVSAAIATGAACRAKKEEVSLAIALSLVFTVVMMVVMPAVIRAVGMDEVVAGAWLGGTIDSTGAVAAAGELVGPKALDVAATVKMIQNILIGAVAFVVAVYWVTYVDRTPGGPQPSVVEIWRRFPKFVIGFVAASAVFSALYATGTAGEATAAAVTAVTGKVLRGWFFCLAFVSIGLESDFRSLSKQLAGGKPLILYVCGQTLNLCLSLLMAWLMFKVVFPDAAR
jgi:uncharacterized integral membrane protein (TIGR00698 family)